MLDSDSRCRRRCGNVGIRRSLPDFQARWEGWKTPPFEFSTLSTARHFHSALGVWLRLARPPKRKPRIEASLSFLFMKWAQFTHRSTQRSLLTSLRVTKFWGMLGLRF